MFVDETCPVCGWLVPLEREFLQDENGFEVICFVSTGCQHCGSLFTSTEALK